MQIFSPRSILVSVIMLVFISLSGRHMSTFLLSRAGTKKSMLIKDTTKELFILTFFLSRKPISWFQPPSEEGIVSAEAPRRYGGGSHPFNCFLVISELGYCALAPVMSPASLL